MKQKEFNQNFVKLISSSSEDLKSLLPYMKEGKKLKAKRALEVYQEDYQARLSEALSNSYPAVHSFLGDEDFYQAASEYIKLHPSLSPDLDEYGNAFSFFLTTHALSNEYIFIAELAAFEWSFREVFHCADIRGLGAAELMNQQEAKLQLIPSARFLHFSFLIDKLYALKDSDEQDPFDYEIEQDLVMFKAGVKVMVRPLTKNQIAIMKNFQHPCSLGEALQNAPATVTPIEIQELFSFLGKERMLLKSNQ